MTGGTKRVSVFEMKARKEMAKRIRRQRRVSKKKKKIERNHTEISGRHTK